MNEADDRAPRGRPVNDGADLDDPPSSHGCSRRQFLMASAAAGACGWGGNASAAAASPSPVSPKRSSAADAAITDASISEAAKVAGVEFTDSERQQMLRGVRQSASAHLQRQREFKPPEELQPATVFRTRRDPSRQTSVDSKSARSTAPRIPSDDEAIAFAPVVHLSEWIRTGQITSGRLTEIYLSRLRRFGSKLECVVNLTEELARSQAQRADEEIAKGRWRGPLHGVPYGAKDLFDTAGIPTTFGAEPYRDRVPTQDAVVVDRLREAGAVLVAKTTLGALAYGDVWFGGKTKNPFDRSQGSSGSSAGSAAGTAAGLFGFSLGTETLGSIVSPSMRCGTTGLRPTFGRVPRTGAMALCWSLDKVGPITRTVEDAALVLKAIHGEDAGDTSSVTQPFEFDASGSLAGLKVGYDPNWLKGRWVTEFDRQLPEKLKQAGATVVEVSLPRLNYGVLQKILTVEAASAFEELTLSNRDDQLTWQDPQAWPNTFREARLIPAIELIQADRFRRQVQDVMQEVMSPVDALAGPSYAGNLLLVTNMTGHPSLTLRAGFTPAGRPHGVTVWGHPFEEATMCRIGMGLEKSYDVWHRRPNLEG
ncbi:MAG: amidase [Planctomycetota bacterium]